jgi:polar amino acid transport system substrate-binding protein
MQMTKKTWLGASLAAALGALLLAAVPSGAQEPAAERPPIPRGTATTIAPSLPPPTGTLDVVRRRGVLRVGVSTFVPWVMNSKKGELIGFEVDVAKQLADDLGVKAEFVETSFPSLLDDLLADRFDIIVTGMSITPARALVANFSIPVGESYARLLASRAKAAGIRAAAGFDRPEVTIGVRAGAIGEDIARKSFPKAKIQPFDDEDAMVDAALNGKVTAVVAWSPAPEFLSAKASDKLFVPLADPLARSREAFAVRKGDPDLLAFLDSWIRYQQDTGWLAERRKYWFDTFAWEDQL